MTERRQERDAIVAWLRKKAESVLIAERIQTPGRIRAFFWAISHPFKFGKEFGRMRALILAANDIEKGAHLSTESEGIE